MFLRDHEKDGEWHIDWEEGMCAYEDGSDILIVDRKIHRHPFGTEYTEILEPKYNYDL
jgi:hypothetical protein